MMKRKLHLKQKKQMCIRDRVIGQHNGYYRYTVGQRKGINVNRDGKHYVLEIRPETNEVVVGRNKDLFANQLIASDFNWISGETPTEPIRISGRTRYHQPLTEGTAEVLENGDVKVTFDEPIRAITKGQSVVLYLSLIHILILIVAYVF